MRKSKYQVTPQPEFVNCTPLAVAGRKRVTVYCHRCGTRICSGRLGEVKKNFRAWIKRVVNPLFQKHLER